MKNFEMQVCRGLESPDKGVWFKDKITNEIICRFCVIDKSLRCKNLIVVRPEGSESLIDCSFAMNEDFTHTFMGPIGIMFSYVNEAFTCPIYKSHSSQLTRQVIVKNTLYKIVATSSKQFKVINVYLNDKKIEIDDTFITKKISITSPFLKKIYDDTEIVKITFMIFDDDLNILNTVTVKIPVTL